jgi:hypothetical protein
MSSPWVAAVFALAAVLFVPAVIITSPGLADSPRIATWYGVLTAATIAPALAGRGH